MLQILGRVFTIHCVVIIILLILGITECITIQSEYTTKLNKEKDSEIIIPHLVDGPMHFYEHSHDRFRRSTNHRDRNNTIFNQMTVYIDFTGFHRNFFIKLDSQRMVPEDMKIFSFGRLNDTNVHSRHTRPPIYVNEDKLSLKEISCFYTGVLLERSGTRTIDRGSERTEVGSAVTLSLCRGVTGLIATSTTDYFIEPSVPPRHSHTRIDFPHRLSRGAQLMLAESTRVYGLYQTEARSFPSTEIFDKQTKVRLNSKHFNQLPSGKHIRQSPSFLANGMRRDTSHLSILTNDRQRKYQDNLLDKQRALTLSNAGHISDKTLMSEVTDKKLSHGKKKLTLNIPEYIHQISYNGTERGYTNLQYFYKQNKVSNKKMRKTMNIYRNGVMKLSANYRDFLLEIANGQDRKKRLTARITNRNVRLSPRSVETLVVIDDQLVKRHGGRKLATLYILTILAMVNQLFSDQSLGVNITIVPIGLVLLNHEQPELKISQHAHVTLNSFCLWQSSVNGLPRTHDLAVLVTGRDICSNKDAPCDTLGFAPVGGMCTPLRSCVVVEDSGLTSAYTIAHEIGHSLSMYHDGDYNACPVKPGYIMTPSIKGHKGRVKWSQCSRDSLHHFLNTVQSSCLQNRPLPASHLSFPTTLPGVRYNADRQCKWHFGDDASLCPYNFGKNLCQNLWCYQGRQKCRTKFFGAVDGTSCGTKKWCVNGQCVRFGDHGPAMVNGGWSQWTQWSTCSQLCGQGTKYIERSCNNPLPVYGGHECRGPRSRHRVCNTQPCPDGSTHSGSSVLCLRYNNKRFHGWKLRWRPATHKREITNCRVVCKADAPAYLFTLQVSVDNGHKCGSRSKGVCVEGKCHRVGCDKLIDSTAERDACGVCRGDNSTCHVTTGTFTQQITEYNYFPIAVIPNTAFNIVISELYLSSNYLAVRTAEGHYYLNSASRISHSGPYRFAGCDWVYSRPKHGLETLMTKGPINEGLIVVLFVRGPNRGVSYHFVLPNTHTTAAPTQTSQILTPRRTAPPPTTTHSSKLEVNKPERTDIHRARESKYEWRVAKSVCTRRCAAGHRTVSATCYRSDGLRAWPYLCGAKSRPKTGRVVCNRQRCQPRWEASEWKACDRECGGGRQRRRVRCMRRMSDTFSRRVARRRCNQSRVPGRSRECNVQDCVPRWYTMAWLKCSVTCGEGRQLRGVRCRQRVRGGKRRVLKSRCDKRDKPDSSRPCKQPVCPFVYSWIISPWTQCSVTCGVGASSRRMFCLLMYSPQTPRRRVKDPYCRHLNRPHVSLLKRCRRKPCSVPAVWVTTSWSQCSKNCGVGVRRRRVMCHKSSITVRSTECDATTAPTVSGVCRGSHCPLLSSQRGKKRCHDNYAWCHLVVQRFLCGNRAYRSRCCESCKVHTSQH